MYIRCDHISKKTRALNSTLHLHALWSPLLSLHSNLHFQLCAMDFAYLWWSGSRVPVYRSIFIFDIQKKWSSSHKCLWSLTRKILLWISLHHFRLLLLAARFLFTKLLGHWKKKRIKCNKNTLDAPVRDYHHILMTTKRLLMP